MLEVSRIDDLYLRQFDTLVTLRQFHQSVLARLGIVVAFHRRRRSAQQHFRIELRIKMCQHDGGTAGMITGGRILLLVTGLVFLVDNDQSQSLEGQEYGTAGAENDIVRIGRQLFLPDFHAFGIGILRMVDAQTIAEDALQTLHHLHRQRYLRQEVEYLFLAFESLADEVDVDFRLTRPRNSMQQRHLFLHLLHQNVVIGILLSSTEGLDEVRTIVATMIQATNFYLVGFE